MVGSDTQDTDGFEFANDGHTIILVQDELSAGAGDTITIECVNDEYGRQESPLTRTITAQKAYSYGPFNPAIWNQTGGLLRFKFTTANAKTEVMVISVKNPQ